MSMLTINQKEELNQQIGIFFTNFWVNLPINRNALKSMLNVVYFNKLRSFRNRYVCRIRHIDAESIIAPTHTKHILII